MFFVPSDALSFEEAKLLAEKEGELDKTDDFDNEDGDTKKKKKKKAKHNIESDEDDDAADSSSPPRKPCRRKKSELHKKHHDHKAGNHAPPPVTKRPRNHEKSSTSPSVPAFGSEGGVQSAAAAAVHRSRRTSQPPQVGSEVVSVPDDGDDSDVCIICVKEKVPAQPPAAPASPPRSERHQKHSQRHKTTSSNVDFVDPETRRMIQKSSIVSVSPGFEAGTAVSAFDALKAAQHNKELIEECRTTDEALARQVEQSEEDDPCITVIVDSVLGRQSYKMHKNDSMKKLLLVLAGQHNSTDGEIILKADGIKVKPTDTPISLALTPNQILKLVVPPKPKPVPCLIIPKETSKPTPTTTTPPKETPTAPPSLSPSPQPASLTSALTSAPAPNDPNLLRIKVQLQNKIHKFKINKDDKFLKLFTGFSKAVNKPLESLKFTFDGEEISPNTTPNDLDFEDDFLVDAKE